ncbi:hypothetical protein IU452_08795 [Nocardia transvalensis]|nr:hypothetical protein [Nocardia transvalensis]
MGGIALLAAGLVTACDSRVGIEGTDYDTGSTSSAVPRTASSIAAPLLPPETSAGEVGVTVSLASPDPKAADALTRWARDLQQLPLAAVERRCWTMAPRNVEAMYSDKQAILDALAQPGVDNGSAIVWKNQRDGVTVAAQRAEIATGYACPRVFPTGSDTGFNDADARHTVRRYLARLTGNPLDPADTDSAFPLVCAARPAAWDPTGTGRSAPAPLATTPGKLSGVKSFVDDSITSQPLRGDYLTVSVPVTGAAGVQQERTFTLKAGERGYCIGDVSS